jgi:hypothetical protein
MTYTSQVMTVARCTRLATHPGRHRQLAQRNENWHDLWGSLRRTLALRYYPLKIGKNLYLNSLKGALVGAPMRVCANCAVPIACGTTRGNGRVEVALGFLFSSPTFNPVVVMVTFTVFPLVMSVTKYAIILFAVPALIQWVGTRQATTRLQGR